MNEEGWLAIRRRFKEVLHNSVIARYEFVYASSQFKESLVSEVDDILRKIDEEY